MTNYKNEESNSFLASLSEETSNQRLPKTDTSNAEYSLVAKQANQQTDVWNRVKNKTHLKMFFVD